MAQPVPDLAVRAAQEEDLDRLVELLAAVAAEGRWIGTEVPVDTGDRRQRLAEALDDEHALVLVADAGGLVVGELWM